MVLPSIENNSLTTSSVRREKQIAVQHASRAFGKTHSARTCRAGLRHVRHVRFNPRSAGGRRATETRNSECRDRQRSRPRSGKIRTEVSFSSTPVPRWDSVSRAATGRSGFQLSVVCSDYANSEPWRRDRIAPLDPWGIFECGLRLMENGNRNTSVRRNAGDRRIRQFARGSELPCPAMTMILSQRPGCRDY